MEKAPHRRWKSHYHQTSPIRVWELVVGIVGVDLVPGLVLFLVLHVVLASAQLRAQPEQLAEEGQQRLAAVGRRQRFRR